MACITFAPHYFRGVSDDGSRRTHHQFRGTGFLNGPKKLYIGGEFVDAASGQTFATYTRLTDRSSQTWHTVRLKTSTARYVPLERLPRTAPGHV